MNLVVRANHPRPYGPPIRIVDVSPTRSSVHLRRQESVGRVHRRIAAALVLGAIALVAIVGSGSASAVVPL